MNPSMDAARSPSMATELPVKQYHLPSIERPAVRRCTKFSERRAERMSNSSVNRATFDEVMVPTYAPGDVIPVSGEGARVWDQEGKEYIDLAGGIAVTALGHSHPGVMAALQEQAAKIWHVSNVMTNEPALKLGQYLCEHTFAEKAFFANSGAEANEAAFKLARRYSWDHHGEGRHEIIAFDGSFHGRTLFTVAVGGQPKYLDGFRPGPEGVRHARFNDAASVKELISDKTCAVVVEPVQGEGGVRPADYGFLRELRRICDDNGLLLIFDEVQCGVGRTGRLYAYQDYHVEPDILTTAKALGNGFPVSAMLTRADIAASFTVGTHGTTYGGNPLACAVARRVLELVNTSEVLDGVAVRHQRLRGWLEAMAEETELFRDVRGRGLLMGAELAEPYSENTKAFVSAALEAGVLVLVAGGTVLRFAPPLNIPMPDLDEALERLETAWKALS